MTCKREKMPKRFIALFLLLFVCASLLFGSDIDENFKKQLNEDEIAFLQSKESIVIGTMDAWPPFNFVDYKNQPKGIGADIIGALNKRLGGKLVISSGEWKEIYKNTQEGQIDAIMDITPKAEREQFFSFTEPYLRVPHVIITRDDAPKISGLDALFGKEVALEGGFGTVKYIKENFPNITIKEYQDTSHCLDALSRGEVFAYIGNRAVATYIINQELIGNLKIQARDTTRKGSVLAFGVTKGEAILRDILQKGLDDMSQSEFNAIFRVWSEEKKAGLALSDEEKSYLRKKGKLRFVSASEEWAPFIFDSANGKSGLEIEFFHLLEEKLNVPIEVEYMQWSKAVESAKEHKVDAIFPASETDDRKRSLLFSKTYYNSPLVLFYKNIFSEIEEWGEFQGQKIGVIRGSSYKQIIKEARKGLKVVEFANTEEIIKGVEEGIVDAGLDMLAPFRYHAAKIGLDKNLKAGMIFYSESLGGSKYGIRNDEPLLKSIIDKAIAAYTQEEIREILGRWEGLLPNNEKEQPIALSKSELKFLKNNPVILLGADEKWMPFDFRGKDGVHSGFNADYLALLKKKLGVDITIELGAWDALQEKVKKKKLAGLVGPSKTKERESYMVFTEPYFMLNEVVLSRKSAPPLSSLSELSGYTLGIKKGNSDAEYIKDRYPKINILIKNSDAELLNALSSGEIDFAMCNLGSASIEIKRNFISNVKVALSVDELAGDMRFGVRNDCPELASVLQKGIRSISEEELEKLKEKWFQVDASDSKEEKLLDTFSNRERQWLLEHKELFYSETDWEPLVFTKASEIEGMIKDYLDIFTEKSGLRFVYRQESFWPNVLNRYDIGELDFIPGMVAQDLVNKDDLASNPYLSFPLVIAGRDDMGFVGSLEQLEGKVVAVGNGYSSMRLMREKYPSLSLKPVVDTESGIRAVANHDADVFVGLAPVVSHWIRAGGFDGVKIAGVSQENLEIVVVSKDPVFISIINKIIASLSPEERASIERKYIDIDLEAKIDYSLVWKISAGALLIALGMLYWNRTMAKEIGRRVEAERELTEAIDELKMTQEAIEEQRKYLQTVLDSQDSILITTDGKKMQSANKAFLKFYGISSVAEFLDTRNCICDTFEDVEGKEYLQQEMDGVSWVEYVYQNQDLVHKASINGDIFSVHVTKFEDKGRELILAVFSNITQLEMIQEEIEKSKKQQELALEGGKMGSWHIDFVSDEMVVNERWAEMLGYTLEELEHPIRRHWIESIHPEDREKIVQIGAEYRKGNVSEYEIEYRSITKSGDVRWFISRGEAVEWDRRGNVTMMAGTVMDITEKKEAEEQIKEFNRKITDSINYASLIQSALLPSSDKLSEFFAEHMALWLPKDIVGGDIYLFEILRHSDEALLMVIDCTGHGVPGAFMTMLVKAIEKSIIADILKGEQDVHPAEILQIFNRTIKTMLKQVNKDSISNAGFDGGILYIDRKRNLARYTGSQTPLFYGKGAEMQVIKGDKKGIGYKTTDMEYVFTEYQIALDEMGSAILSTDGYLDQNGGATGFPFGKKRFMSILSTHADKKLFELEAALYKELEDYQGANERNDDITVVALRL